jgi:hypothetical protein
VTLPGRRGCLLRCRSRAAVRMRWSFSDQKGVAKA